MKKRIMAFAVCFFLLIISIQAYATTSSSTGKSQKQLEEEQESVESSISANESKLEELMTSISSLEMSLEQKGDEIGQAQDDLAAAKKKQESQYEAMKLRIQYMYENGSSLSYISTFLGSGSFSDMLNKMNYISDVYTFDRDLLAEYGETTKKITDLNAKLESEMTELENLQASYSEQQESLEAEQTALKEQSEDYETQIAEAKEAAARRQAQLLAAQTSTAKSSNSGTQTNSGNSGGSGGSGSSNGSGSSGSYSSLTGINPPYTTGVSGSAVVAYAKQFIGNPYEWGGDDINNGIDCSGFVYFVFNHFGITVPRNSYADRSAGSQVSIDCIAPGDIVCTKGHVAIYIGENKVISALNTASGIKITPLNRSEVITVRRVL